MFCKNCGSEIFEGDNFCKSCGASTKAARVDESEAKSLEKKVWYRVLKVFYIFSYAYLLTLSFVTLYDDISSNIEDSQIVQIQQKIQLRLPDGRIVKGIPEGTTEEQVLNKLIERGILSADKKPLFDEAIRRGLIRYENEQLPDGFVIDEPNQNDSYQITSQYSDVPEGFEVIYAPEQSKSKMKPWERFGDKKRQEWSATKVFVKPFLQFLETLIIGFLTLELARAALLYVILNQKPDNIIFRYAVNFLKKIRSIICKG